MEDDSTSNQQGTKKELLLDPMQHLIITPLHCICTICQGDDSKKKKAIFTIQIKALRRHFKNLHGDVFVLGKFKNISTSLEVAKLRATNGGWRKQIFNDELPCIEKHTVCTACNATFGKESHHFKRHTLNSTTCNATTKVKRDCIKLICGGWYPVPTNVINVRTNQLQQYPPSDPTNQVQQYTSSLDRKSRMPQSTCTTIKQYEKLLQPFVSESTNVGSWAQVLSTSVSLHGGDKFGDYIKSTLEMIFEVQKSPNPKVFEAL